jgi:hypothetical protein
MFVSDAGAAGELRHHRDRQRHPAGCPVPLTIDGGLELT